MTKLKELQLKNKGIELQTENLMSKYKFFAKIDLNQSSLINSLLNSNDDNVSLDNILLNKYYIHEILTGIKIVDRLPYENREMFEQSNTQKPWFDILLSNLPDECLDLEQNLENYSPNLKQNLNHLTPSFLDFYKSIFRVINLLSI